MGQVPLPGGVPDGVVGHVVVGVVTHHMALRHHAHQRLLIPRHNRRVVLVQVVRIDEETGPNTNLDLVLKKRALEY